MTAPTPTHDEAQKWLQAFHTASATLNAHEWLETFTTPDVVFQYANNAPLSGREATTAMLHGVLSCLEKMTHEVLYFDYVPPRLYQAAMIEYVVKGDDTATQTIRIPGFAVFWLVEEGGVVKCSRAETFLDPGEVLGRIREKFGGEE
ncbi:hypothetical protein ANO11243_093560 [Dothideomycetidae sp. 11243]|nr:hypothetical protein ANO11243_093560 [fungal sp. No.11243]